MDQNNKYLWDIDNPLGYKNTMGYYKTKIEYEFILHHLKHDNLRILDIGGGSGRFAIPLVAREHDVTIVDNSALAMECLKKRDNGRIKFICDDFMSCALDENSFDAVIAIESVLFFQDREKLFRKINQVLVPGGIFIFTELNKHSWRYLVHQMFRRDNTNYNVKSVDECISVLTINGFEVDDMKGFMWIPLSVISDSLLVNLFTFIETHGGFQKWIRQSPWLLVAAQKKP